MNSRITALATTAWLLTAPGTLAAQVATANVTLSVPLNLTDLAADVFSVKVSCTVYKALDNRDVLKEQSFSASGGQVIRTANFAFLLNGPQATSGGSWTYKCEIRGFSSSRGGYLLFSDSGQADYLYLRPTPGPNSGSFVL